MLEKMPNSLKKDEILNKLADRHVEIEKEEDEINIKQFSIPPLKENLSKIEALGTESDELLGEMSDIREEMAGRLLLIAKEDKEVKELFADVLEEITDHVLKNAGSIPFRGQKE